MPLALSLARLISIVIPGRLEEANPESRDSQVCKSTPEFGASNRPGMTEAKVYPR
jgi:hypothetical protein